MGINSLIKFVLPFIKKSNIFNISNKNIGIVNYFLNKKGWILLDT